jgi:adenylyltransferase/sulfurtransferase
MASSAPPLRPEQFERHRRHLSLPGLGVEGQRKLLIGARGLGCPLAQCLAAANRLGLLDFGVVAPSNLQRQALYGIADVGRPKMEVARKRIEAMNPDVASPAGGIEARLPTVDPEVPRSGVDASIRGDRNGQEETS